MSESMFWIVVIACPGAFVVAFFAIIVPHASDPVYRNRYTSDTLPPVYDDLAVYNAAVYETRNAGPSEMKRELDRLQRPRPSTPAEWYADYKRRNSMTLEEYRRQKWIEEHLPTSVKDWNGE